MIQGDPRTARRDIGAPSQSASYDPDGVHVRGLTRRFGDNRVLVGLDLDLQPGSFTALLGRSGSGKSTLLRTLAGLDPLPPDAVMSKPERSTVVFQEPRLLPWRRVWRNVAIGLPGPDVRARAEAALAEVNLAHRINAWPGTLSGGEAQRAALARALVREPRLLLLDEPFAALDALTRLRMQALVIDLWRAHAPTTLLVTHDVDEAIVLADRALVLENGRITADVPIDLPRADRHAHPDFASLRHRLLGLLGVHTAMAATRPAVRPVSTLPATEPVA
jgi:sulfonate transport system ATP-binding protein